MKFKKFVIGLCRIASVVLLACISSSVGATTIEDIYAWYGDITTIAGVGTVRDGGLSGWNIDMEGGPAIEAELSRPHMAMADVEGNVYIADKDAQAIRMVRTDGTIHTIVGTNEFGYNLDEGQGTDVQLASPNGLFTFPNGTTYILDLDNSRIMKWTTDGYVSTVFTDDNGMTVGRGLWVSPDESTILYASGTEIRSWTADEGIAVYADGFSALGNIAFDPTDNMLVATDRDANLVYKIDVDGEKTVIAGNGDTSGGIVGGDPRDLALKEVRGVAFNPDGSYFLATHDGGQIWFVDSENTIHLAIDGDDNHTHAGDGEDISVPGQKISEPRAIVLAPNNDLLITENDFGYIRRVEWIGIVGDFDNDMVLDVDDIDLLSAGIRNGVENKRFDLNGNNAIDEADRTRWVKDLKVTYFGDSNLDGEFNSNDFVVVFQAGQYEDDLQGNSTWATGDWNGDGDFTSGDFVLAFQDGGYEQGPAAARSVPEPVTPVCGLLLGSLLVIARRRR
jgi:DNA-binding beta-propeller fold protein YncE